MGLAECSRSYDCGIPLFFCLFFSEYLEEKNIAYTFACEMSTRTITATGILSSTLLDRNRNSAATDDTASTLELIASIDRDYAKKITDEGYDMAYNWCWGDVLDDVPDEVFAAAGLDLRIESVAAYVASDEIVVERIM